jgi:predicted amidohydrolase
MKLKIGLVQMLSEKGAVADNLKAISGFINEADKRGIDILGLPEACITGYNNPLKFPKAVLSTEGPEIAALLKMTALPRKDSNKKLTVLAGLIETNPGNKPFLTHIVVSDGKITGRCRKHITKDETSDWFSSASEINVFEYEGLKYGISICADIGYAGLFKEYARQGVKIVFELAAPGLYGDQSTRNWETGYKWWEDVCLERLGKYAKKHGIWVAVATAAGRTSDEDFPGGGYLFSPDGTRVYATKDWKPCEVYLEIDMDNDKVREI